jgi:hypothetical protein
MRPSAKSHVPSESSDAVGLVIALLVRYPEVATIVSHPADGTLTLSFAVALEVDRAAEREIRESVSEHVRALLALGGEEPDVIAVDCECDGATSFVRITRDARSFTREELQVLVAVLAGRFGDGLIKSPASDDDDSLDDDLAADELVDYALDAIRDPQSQRSLVGFREEKRVLVYFVAARKKAKARARS